jgi:hypothetical protein
MEEALKKESLEAYFMETINKTDGGLQW